MKEKEVRIGVNVGQFLRGVEVRKVGRVEGPTSEVFFDLRGRKAVG